MIKIVFVYVFKDRLINLSYSRFKFLVVEVFSSHLEGQERPG